MLKKMQIRVPNIPNDPTRHTSNTCKKKTETTKIKDLSNVVNVAYIHKRNQPTGTNMTATRFLLRGSSPVQCGWISRSSAQAAPESETKSRSVNGAVRHFCSENDDQPPGFGAGNFKTKSSSNWSEGLETCIQIFCECLETRNHV